MRRPRIERREPYRVDVDASCPRRSDPAQAGERERAYCGATVAAERLECSRRAVVDVVPREHRWRVHPRAAWRYCVIWLWSAEKAREVLAEHRARVARRHSRVKRSR